MTDCQRLRVVSRCLHAVEAGVGRGGGDFAFAEWADDMADSQARVMASGVNGGRMRFMVVLVRNFEIGVQPRFWGFARCGESAGGLFNAGR